MTFCLACWSACTLFPDYIAPIKSPEGTFFDSLTTVNCFHPNIYQELEGDSFNLLQIHNQIFIILF